MIKATRRLAPTCLALLLVLALPSRTSWGESHDDAKAAGSLTVKIKPKDAKTDGARWRVDGGAWLKNGETVEGVEEGEHTVSFKDAVGWKTPKNQAVSVTAGGLTTVAVKYKRAASMTIMLPGDVPLELVWIPAGSFMMGRYTDEQDSSPNESPQHEVTLANGFWMGKHELTKAQWTAVMNTSPWSGQDFIITDADSPAVYVSWDDAQAFLAALNAHIANTGQGAATYRLPSEAQWEYACRAGTATRFYWGDDPNYTVINDYAWWYGNGWAVGQGYAHVVGLKTENGFGLVDMSGNVYEWCEDLYQIDYTGAPTDGSTWISPLGSDRVARGGGFYDYGSGDWTRSAKRASFHETDANSTLGIRLVR